MALRVMVYGFVVVCASLAPCRRGAAQERALVPVYDARLPFREPRVPRADLLLLQREALPAARQRWSADPELEPGRCVEEFEVIDVTVGAFTRRGAVQRAYLYRYCSLSHAEGSRGGVVVVEGGRVAAHATGVAGHGLFAARDVDRNGMDELVMTDGFTAQGHTTQSVVVMEIAGSAFHSLGSFEVGANNCGTIDEPTRQDSYVLFARPGPRPGFVRQRYRGTCPGPPGGDRVRWARVGGLEPVETGADGQDEVRFRVEKTR